MILRWVLTNVILVAIILFISLYRGYDSSAILYGKLVAQAAFILFLVNSNMYIVFLLIRKSRIREVKVKLAKISKKLMRYHIPFAVSASVLILVHIGIMVYTYWSSLLQQKILTGIAAVAILPILLYSGYRRHKKATGRRRKSHYWMAFIFLFFVGIHIFV
ncbi:hypothetical protein A8F94_22180 [Bacillus sp. FJAT-27225]|uniref:hypothetical protein n=1 Tax=Bacillus sp. FJAT-27225 TaxID=1743144 RepID=UPI00080C2A5D|nr:hypothetical protein [Bacillus sp. FJAT-27225]OCA81581.1 hypothetical protein A8F94_22180 [Bacillus sp. FJAT-27225]